MRKSFRLLGVGALLFAGSFLGSYFANTQGVEQRVKEEVDKTRLEARITLPFGTDTLFAIPDRIKINDSVNNTSVTIRRNRRSFLGYMGWNMNRKGIFEYEGCDQETAKSLFDLYTAKFQDFQRVHNIRARIGDYTPRMKIVEINPWGN